jgi:hypothetical protein
MRRLIPYALLGLLLAGTAAAVGWAVADGPSGTAAPAQSPPPLSPQQQSAQIPPASAAGGPGGVTPGPDGSTRGGIAACALITRSQAQALLHEIVNASARGSSPFCAYEGIIAVSGAAQPPTVTVTVVSDSHSVAQAEAILTGDVGALCGTPAPASCAQAFRLYQHATVDGVAVVSRQSASASDITVASAITESAGRVVVVTTSGLPAAQGVALAAMRALIPRL